MYVIIMFSFQLVLDIFQIGPRDFTWLLDLKDVVYSLSQVFSILNY